MNELFRISGEALIPGALLLAAVAFALAFLGIFFWTRLNRAEIAALSAGLSCSKAIGGSFWRTVHSGQEKHHFFDADRFLGEPENINRFASWFRDTLRESQREIGQVDSIAFIEKLEGPVGLLTCKDLLSSNTKIPGVILRPHRRLIGGAIKGSLKRSDRVIQPGDNVVVVSDVITTGETFLDAIRLLEECKAEIKLTLALYDREDEDFDKAEFQRRNIQLKTMLNRHEVEAWLDKELEPCNSK